jgi:hypothetical protein
MPCSRRILAALVAVGLLAAGCQNTPEPPANTTISATPTTSPTPVDLTEPKNARQAVDELHRYAGQNPVIQVTITRAEATLTVVADDKAKAYGWINGQITELDTDIEYIGQQEFNPDDFAIDNVGSLFLLAGAVTASQSDQQLQINEYNNGRVMMTVTTSPESQTVFFRPDGSMVHFLNPAVSADVAEAFEDLVPDQHRVLSLGLNEQGFYAEVRISDSIIETRVRPLKTPVYEAQRNQTSTATEFNAELVDPRVISDLSMQIPKETSTNSTPKVYFNVSCQESATTPQITFTVDGNTRLFDLTGHEIKDQPS